MGARDRVQARPLRGALDPLQLGVAPEQHVDDRALREQEQRERRRDRAQADRGPVLCRDGF